MKVMLDENVSGGLAHALKKLGHTVLAVARTFPPALPMRMSSLPS